MVRYEYELGKASDILVGELFQLNIAKRAVESVGLQPQVRAICGGTDGSIYNEKGIQTVVLGMGVKSEHSKDENIAVADMEKAVSMIQHIFEELSE